MPSADRCAELGGVSGLANEQLTVRALDSGWKLKKQADHPGDEVVWVANERLGVQRPDDPNPIVHPVGLRDERSRWGIELAAPRLGGYCFDGSPPRSNLILPGALMFHPNCGVTLHCTPLAIPPVMHSLECIWTRKISSPLDLYFRPLAYGGSVFVLFRDRRVTRLTEHDEETIDCAMNTCVELMGAGRYLLIPSADQQLGVYSLRDKSLRVVSGLEGWHPCGAETSESETSVVFREQSLCCERGELVPNGRKLIGNLIGGVLYGVAREADGSETRGALGLHSNEWLWKDDRFVSLIELHDETMIVNVLGEAKNQGEVWDRRTREPIHRRTGPYVAGHSHFREDSVISQGGVFDLATGELRFPLSYSTVTTYLSQGSQLWYLEDRLATGGRDQAIVCLDVDEQQELYRLPIGSVKGRGRSDFMYDDGKFYRLLGRRLECYAPAE